MKWLVSYSPYIIRPHLEYSSGNHIWRKKITELKKTHKRTLHYQIVGESFQSAKAEAFGDLFIFIRGGKDSKAKDSFGGEPYYSFIKLNYE